MTISIQARSLPSGVVTYLEDLIADPHVSGILLFGSWARGNSRPESDIDLIVIGEGEVRREVVALGSITAEVVRTTEAAARDFWRSQIDDCADLWSYAKVLFDRDGAVDRLRSVAEEIIKAGKPVMPEWKVRHVFFDVEDSIAAAERIAATDRATARLLMNNTVGNLTVLFFDLRCLWTPPPKLRLAVMRDRAPHVARFFDEILASQQEGELAAMLATTREISKRVFDLVSTL